MEKKHNLRELFYIVVIMLLVVNNAVIYMLMQSNETFEENLMDIDRRLTCAEQSQTETDTAVIKALQCANESLYEIKILKGDIIK